jgi:tetratricopeptide (TPR) repeat protein
MPALSLRSGLLLGALLLMGPPPSPAGAQTAPPFDALASELATIDSLRSRGQFQSALSHLDRLAKSHPGRTDVLWRRALMLSDLGRAHRNTAPTDTTVARHRRALEVARRACTHDSTSAWAHLTMALAAGRLTLHVKRGNRIRYSRLVKRHADRAIALDSTLAPAFHLRGRWHREVADINVIKRALAKAIYGGLPGASFDRSIHNFRRAIALESKPYNHLELAKTYLKVGRDSSARAQLRQALQTTGSPFEHEHHREARALLDRLD